MSQWTRPASVPLPSIWSTFEGRIEINGKKRVYWIQDITDEYREEVIRYMVEEFVADEPLCKYSKTYESSEAKVTFENVWRETLKQNLGLVCLTVDENNKPTVAAMNCTTLCSRFEEKNADMDKIDNQVLQTLMFVKEQVDPFEMFKISEYLDAMGLYVPPKYRGEGLGLELLKAREALCRACGLKASLTLYTSKISQKLAERAGFKDVYAIDYDELEKRDPRLSFPGIQEHTKSLRFMYILYA